MTRITGDEPAPELVADAAEMLRTLFSVEQITAALHERMIEAAASEHYYPETNCDDDGHREEAEDLHARVLALQFGRAVSRKRTAETRVTSPTTAR